jgi:beta-fructofuranosidase
MISVLQDEGALVPRIGYQGCFTPFRDLFVQITRNVDPGTPCLNVKGSWGVRTEKDGSTSVLTLGQHVIPEILTAYCGTSQISQPADATLSTRYTPFKTQPTGNNFAVKGQFIFPSGNASMFPSVGFRVLASQSEYTAPPHSRRKVCLSIVRGNSSLIGSCASFTRWASVFLLTTLNFWNSWNLHGGGEAAVVERRQGQTGLYARTTDPSHLRGDR